MRLTIPTHGASGRYTASLDTSEWSYPMSSAPCMMLSAKRRPRAALPSMAYSSTEENVSRYADLLKQSLTAAGGSTDLQAADSVSD